ncbi:hypothetical protein OC846_000475 [Tilletia horrida]|uniref:Uncharacterized protein n=1 Tax=Tilletia horrida TaxID=155126 RepID=A0AAN6GUV9_9BASI|nr:hypothetical protein OC845_001123 [Tilletia horrida]KAK0557487.1 hypothetical protein OC846_000475 [Tilletia horrida]KAK0567896.1 hypothetical protein OC861_002456 [Tilletia horrida]
MASTTTMQQRRPSAASSSASAASHADPLRSRRAPSGSGSTIGQSARTNRVPSGAAAFSSSAAAGTTTSRVTSAGAVPARLREGIANGSKSNLLSASSPSPTRKIRDPLRPVPALPPLPALPSTTTGSSDGGTASGAGLSEARRGAIRGLPGAKKRPVPDSFDARNGIPGLDVPASNADADKGKAADLPSSATKSEFHIGSSATASSAVRAKMRGLTTLDTGRARSGSGATGSSHMEADELHTKRSPLSSRQTSPLPPESVQEEEPRLARRSLLGAVVAVSDDGEPELRARPRSIPDMRDREGGVRSRDEERGDSASPHDQRPLRPALKKPDSISPTNGPIGGAIVPSLSRSSSTRSESPSVRTPLEPIPETIVTHRRIGSDRDYISDREERAGSALSRRREGRDAYAASPVGDEPRVSPTRTTRFAPLPPSHNEERVFADRDRAALRRGRAPADYDRDDGQRVNPLTRSMTSFDDLRTSGPLASQRTDNFTKLTSLHGPSPLHSTPAPPSRSSTPACMMCGQHLERASRFSDPMRQQPEAAATPSLTKADLDDAIARVTDIFEARIAEIQLDIFRSARQSRNAIVDEMRTLNCSEEGMSEELNQLREENRMLRARLQSAA